MQMRDQNTDFKAGMTYTARITAHCTERLKASRQYNRNCTEKKQYSNLKMENYINIEIL